MPSTSEDIDWGDLPTRRKALKVFSEPGEPSITSSQTKVR